MQDWSYDDPEVSDGRGRGWGYTVDNIAGTPTPDDIADSIIDASRMIKPSVLDDIGVGMDLSEEEEENEARAYTGLYQPTIWWFTSTAFPLFSGTLGPIATLFSVCALVQTCRLQKDDGGRVSDPSWLTAMNCCSLACAAVANLVLLFNFARRIRYEIAQPVTIILWYFSCVLLVVPVGVIRSPDWTPDTENVAFSQSYYYALISSVIYCFISTILLGNALGTYTFHAYPPSFNNLTVSQRTLMLQTTSFCLYLALGAGVFSRIQEDGFSDMLYWADYTLTTVGLGSDFPLKNTVGRMVLIPYAAFGIVLLGLVVTSVRGLLLERARTKMFRRQLAKERDYWIESIRERKRAWILARRGDDLQGSWRDRRRLRRAERMVHRFKFYTAGDYIDLAESVGRWNRTEFELMRYIQQRMEIIERYSSLSISFSAVVVIWFGGAIIFWACDQTENGLGMTYVDSIYFSYTTLTTIGFGDFYPTTNAGRPFFVIFTLLAIPVMTVFISNMGDTIVLWVKSATEWLGRRTVLPERALVEGDWERRKKWEARLRHLRHPTTLGMRILHGREQARQRVEDLGPEIARIDGAMREARRLNRAVREETLSSRLAKEISRTAKDIGQTPGKQYDWSEWKWWLKLLGEEGETFKPLPIPNDRGSTYTRAGEWVRQQSYISASEETSRTPSGTDQRSPAMCIVDASVPIPEGWHWTWLADRGPMMSRGGESQWINAKLCERLEDVIQREKRQAAHGYWRDVRRRHRYKPP